jgi:hypothetical protein
MQGMFSYPKAAAERAMQVQEVILRAMARKITWWQAAEILGISDRQMRRRRERYEAFGFRGLFDRRRGQPSPKRVPLAVLEKVLGLYRDRIEWRRLKLLVVILIVFHIHGSMQFDLCLLAIVPSRSGKSHPEQEHAGAIGWVSCDPNT